MGTANTTLNGTTNHSAWAAGDRLPAAETSGARVAPHSTRVPESPFLPAPRATSRELKRVLSSLRDESKAARHYERAFFKRQLCWLARDKDLRNLFASAQTNDEELRSYLVNDAIDYLCNAGFNDQEKSHFLVALLSELPGLVSKSALPSTAERLLSIHNELSPDEQTPSLVAIAEVIKHFPPEASESWLARLTHILATQKQDMPPGTLQTLLCDLADLTPLIRDGKKMEHVYRVFALMNDLHPMHWAICYSHLAPHLKNVTVKEFATMVGDGVVRRLTNEIRAFFGLGQLA